MGMNDYGRWLRSVSPLWFTSRRRAYWLIVFPVSCSFPSGSVSDLFNRTASVLSFEFALTTFQIVRNPAPYDFATPFEAVFVGIPF